jgi:hypothetical protein
MRRGGTETQRKERMLFSDPLSISIEDNRLVLRSEIDLRLSYLPYHSRIRRPLHYLAIAEAWRVAVCGSFSKFDERTRAPGCWMSMRVALHVLLILLLRNQKKLPLSLSGHWEQGEVRSRATRWYGLEASCYNRQMRYVLVVFCFR